MPNNNREWNKSQPHGMEVEETFTREEIAIPVKCNIHPWMRAYIAVFKHPYFAVTDRDGKFEIKNLPPGTYTIKAWQEKLGTQTQKITVAGGEAKEHKLRLQIGVLSTQELLSLGMPREPDTTAAYRNSSPYRAQPGSCSCFRAVHDLLQRLVVQILLYAGWKRTVRTSPEASTTAETQGALQRGAMSSAWPRWAWKC